MKKYLGVLCLGLLALLAIMVGLTLVEYSKQPELTGEAWCDAMVDKPNSDWSEADTRRFSKTCLFNHSEP